MRLRLLVPAMSCVAFSACGLCAITCPSPCQPLVSHYPRLIVAQSSARPIARFGFQQTVTVNNGDDCPSRDLTGSVALEITSLTSETSSFAYRITGYDDRGEAAWTYAGRVTRLAAGDTIIVGAIADSTVPVVLGTGPLVELTEVSFP